MQQLQQASGQAVDALGERHGLRVESPGCGGLAVGIALAVIAIGVIATVYFVMQR